MPSAGRVGRPHGLDGHFHVNDAMPRLIEVGRQVIVGDVATEIVAVKGTGERPIARLAIAADRTAVEALRGADLVVPEEATPALDEDEYWAEDLVGCRVVSSSSGVLGVVTALLALPSCEALEVSGRVDPIPLVRDAVVRVDLEAREIEVDGGFLGAA